MDRHPRGLLRIAYVRVCRRAHGGGSSGAGWTQLRWGGQQAPGTRETRGEGADLGEGLAAAGKQEAAAHVTTVAAAQPRSQEHGHPGVDRGARRCPVRRTPGGHAQVKPTSSGGTRRPGTAAPAPRRGRASTRAPGRGTIGGGVAGLRELVVVRGAVPPAVAVPRPAVAVERVPGLLPVVPVRTVPPALVAVPGVQVAGNRRSAMSRTESALIWLTSWPSRRRAPPGDRPRRPRDERADGEVTGAGFGVADRRQTESGGRGEFTLRQVSDPPDPTQRATDIERLHGWILEDVRGRWGAPEPSVDGGIACTRGRSGRTAVPLRSSASLLTGGSRDRASRDRPRRSRPGRGSATCGYRIGRHDDASWPSGGQRDRTVRS